MHWLHGLPLWLVREELHKLTEVFFFYFVGESSQSLSYHFRMGVSTIRQFIPETCEVIYRVLKEKYLKVCIEALFIDVYVMCS